MSWRKNPKVGGTVDKEFDLGVETLMTFPDGWYINEERKLLDNRNELLVAYYQWARSIYNCETYEERYKLIDDKLNELSKI